MRLAHSCLVLAAVAVIGCGTSATSVVDGGPTSDGGPAADGGPVLDGGPAPDGGTIADGGPAPDAGLATDGGPAPDGGTTADGGPATDGGPVAGDTCQTATTISAGTLSGQTTGATNDYSGGLSANNCTGSDSGADVVYAIVVPAGQRLTASIETGDPLFDPSIYLIAAPASNCEATPRLCLAADDTGTAETVNRVAYTNRTAASQTIFIVVDTFSSTRTGPFTLTTAIETPPPAPAGDICQTATAASAGTLMGQTTAGFANDYTGGSAANGCTSATAGLDRVYTVSVPAGQRLTARVTPEATYNPSVYVVAGPASSCDSVPRVCLASSNEGGQGVAETVQWVNAGTAAAEVFVVVDSPATDAGGGFTLDIALDTPPAGDVCQTATAAAAGTLAEQTTVGYSNNYGAGAGCAGTAGVDRVYSTEVPAGQRLTATVTPSTAFDPSISVVAGPAANCDVAPRVCLAGSDARLAGQAETVTWLNTSDSSRTVFLVVDSDQTGATGSGTFDLTVALATPPAGDVCQTATPVVSGTPLTGQTTVGYGNDYGPGTGCTGTAGADRVYSISVPAGMRVTATVTPAPGYDPSINLVSGPASNCDASPRTCLASSDAGYAGQPDTALWVNDTGSDRTVFLVVDSYTTAAAGTGTFDLAVTIDTPPPPPPGDTCQTAEMITAGTLADQTTVGYAANYSPDTDCTGYSALGRDRVYAISLPSGQKLTATVQPAAGFDAGIYLIQAPASNCDAIPIVCLAGNDQGGEGESDTVTYTNTSGSAQTIFIVIDHFRASDPGGAFTLTTAIGPP